MRAPRQMTLTPDLVAQVHRVLEDPGPDPNWAYHSDSDYDAVVKALLTSRPGGPDTWLFAYGSLIWKPEVEHVEVRQGTARGWHRSFCFRIVRFRGTKEQPGLMMSLDRGGQCQGVLFRLAPENLEGQLSKLVRREMTVKPPNNLPRWISVETDHEQVRALAFVMNRQSRFYVGKLTAEEVADVLARACGHWGSGAEYICNNVTRLEEHGIHDRGLWKLQELVAARIEQGCHLLQSHEASLERDYKINDPWRLARQECSPTKLGGSIFPWLDTSPHFASKSHLEPRRGVSWVHKSTRSSGDWQPSSRLMWQAIRVSWARMRSGPSVL